MEWSARRPTLKPLDTFGRYILVFCLVFSVLSFLSERNIKSKVKLDGMPVAATIPSIHRFEFSFQIDVRSPSFAITDRGCVA